MKFVFIVSSALLFIACATQKTAYIAPIKNQQYSFLFPSKSNSLEQFLYPNYLNPKLPEFLKPQPLKKFHHPDPLDSILSRAKTPFHKSEIRIKKKSSNHTGYSLLVKVPEKMDSMPVMIPHLDKFPTLP